MILLIPRRSGQGGAGRGRAGPGGAGLQVLSTGPALVLSLARALALARVLVLALALVAKASDAAMRGATQNRLINNGNGRKTKMARWPGLQGQPAGI